MDKKSMAAVIVVMILIIAAVSAFVALDDKSIDNGEPTVLDNAELKVYGNINGDRYIDDRDVSIIKDLIKEGKTADEYPLADANQDGVLDSKDLDVVEAVANGESTTIWHINYHDVDADGAMDEEVVSSKFPITSTIMTGSPHSFMLTFILGIVDEVKGACYSGTVDKALFGDYYLNQEKVEKLGSKSYAIPFEDGKVGSSDIIAKKGVTALITDWNKIYITNEKDFENAGIDVIRVAAASVDEPVMKHSALLLGLLFQKIDRANEYLEFSENMMENITSLVKDVDKKKVIVSSTTENISSGDSDYVKLCIMAGAEFALDDKVDFNNKNSVPIADHPEVYTYEIDDLIHLRTGLSYGQTPDSIAKMWEEYTKPFEDAPSTMNQYLVSGTVPICLRVGYVSCALYSDVVSLELVNDYHKQFIDKFYNGLSFDIDSMKFIVSGTA